MLFLTKRKDRFIKLVCFKQNVWIAAVKELISINKKQPYICELNLYIYVYIHEKRKKTGNG